MKFIADDMLGRLAKWLRILGFDTLYFPKILDYELLKLASLEGRPVLTRDRKLFAKTIASEIFLVQDEHYLKQCGEVLAHFKLKVSEERIFSFCLDCNLPVRKVFDKESIRSLIPPYVFEHHPSFHQCPRCLKVFWSGSHYSSTLEKIRTLP